MRMRPSNASPIRSSPSARNSCASWLSNRGRSSPSLVLWMSLFSFSWREWLLLHRCLSLTAVTVAWMAFRRACLLDSALMPNLKHDLSLPPKATWQPNCGGLCCSISPRTSPSSMATSVQDCSPAHWLSLNSTAVTTCLSHDAELHDAMIGIAEKRLDKAGLAAVFRDKLSAER